MVRLVLGTPTPGPLFCIFFSLLIYFNYTKQYIFHYGIFLLLVLGHIAQALPFVPIAEPSRLRPRGATIQHLLSWWPHKVRKNPTSSFIPKRVLLSFQL